MSHIAKIVVDVAVDREFDYLVPEALRESVALGSRVRVPFGRREATGYVVGFAESSTYPGLKEIRSLDGEKPILGETVLRLARWMSEYYCSPIETAIQAVLPGAVRRKGARHKAELFVALRPAADEPAGVEAPRKRTPKQDAIVEVLRASGGMFLRDLARAAGTNDSTVRALEKKGLVSIARRTIERDPLVDQVVLPTTPLVLMAEQAAALDMVKASMDTLKPPVVLLHGVTGSGKTEVYLQAIAHGLDRGRGAIVLVPEIALTPQTVERFQARFGDRIAVLHSHLSEGERHDEWYRIHSGRAPIVIGARSAVFAPLPNLGLIVVDEEHEHTYKQEETPRYSARDVAVMRGHIERCAVLLGSATPSLESYWNVRRGKYALARLPRRVDHRTMPVMRVLDMRRAPGSDAPGGIFSVELIEAIRSRLDRAEQTILFLNRRGFATTVMCPACGHVEACNHCSVSFTYHKQSDNMRCHICGSARRVPEQCPACGDRAFKFTGVGTQRVEAAVRKIFPHAKVQRMDADITVRKDSYRRILGDFRVGKIDILIGTQMIAKGLHFPNVTLIGVIHADLSLHMPDFRAGERTFQLLTQVAGRAGRGEVPGLVIVQTYTPFHPAVQAARRLDYEGFFDQELEFRRELNFPPFSRLVCLTARGVSEEQVQGAIGAFAKALKAILPAKVQLSEPVPAPLARAQGFYRYQLMLRGSSARAMNEPLKQALAAFKWPPRVSCVVDVDAVSLM